MIPWTQYCGRSVASGAQRWRCSTNRCRSMNERIHMDECTTATSRYSRITLTHFPCDNHYLLPKQHHHKQLQRLGYSLMEACWTAHSTKTVAWNIFFAQMIHEPAPMSQSESNKLWCMKFQTNSNVLRTRTEVLILIKWFANSLRSSDLSQMICDLHSRFE